MARSMHNNTNINSTTKDAQCDMRKREVKCSDLFDLVEKDYKANRRKSQSNIAYQVANHLGPFFNDRSAERIGAQHIEDYKDQRLVEGAKRATINLELSTLRRGFSLGKRRGLISKAPHIQTFPIGNTNRRLGFFEHDEYLRLLAVLPPYQKQILRFGYASGWREGEIFNLRWDENYDEAGNCIRIYVSKSGKGRTLPLNIGELADIIAEQKQRRVGRCPYIFHNQGYKCNRNTFGRNWRKACEVANVNHHFHDLRRTVVRNLTRAGVPRVIAKTITGHESDAVFERYDIVDERDIVTALGQMQSYITARTITRENNESNGSANRAPIVRNNVEVAERVGFEPT